MLSVALLRGINVSGQKLIPMTTLQEIFTQMGFQKVETYIQTGNVIFEPSSKKVEKLELAIKKQLMKSLGYEIEVMLRSASEVKQILELNPFKKTKMEPETKLYVSLLSELPDPKLKQALEAIQNPVDELKVLGKEVYILCRKGYGKSQFSNTFIEKKLSLMATTRNWNTMNKLDALVSQ